MKKESEKSEIKKKPRHKKETGVLGKKKVVSSELEAGGKLEKPILGKEGESKILQEEIENRRIQEEMERKRMDEEALALEWFHEEVERAYQQEDSGENTDEFAPNESDLANDQLEKRKREEEQKAMIDNIKNAQDFDALYEALKDRLDLADYVSSAQQKLKVLKEDLKNNKVSIETINSVLGSGDLFKSLDDMPELKEKTTELLKVELYA